MAEEVYVRMCVLVHKRLVAIGVSVGSLWHWCESMQPDGLRWLSFCRDELKNDDSERQTACFFFVFTSTIHPLIYLASSVVNLFSPGKTSSSSNHRYNYTKSTQVTTEIFGAAAATTIALPLMQSAGRGGRSSFFFFVSDVDIVPISRVMMATVRRRTKRDATLSGRGGGEAKLL